MPRIKNARESISQGIKFKSRLEAQAYLILTNEFDDVGYETTKFLLQEGYYPLASIYSPDKRKNFRLHKEKIRDITYTVDFTVNYNGQTYYIETKGMVQEVYSIKKKLLFKDNNIKFFEVHNKTQLLKAIEIIKNGNKKETD